MQSGLFRNVMRYTNFALFPRMMIQVGFSAGYATAFLWGIFGIRSGAVTFGTMTAFLQLVAQIQNPMVELSRQIPAFIRVMTAAERLAELSDAPLEQTGKPVVLTPKLQECAVTGSGSKTATSECAYCFKRKNIFYEYPER